MFIINIGKIVTGVIMRTQRSSCSSQTCRRWH